MLLNYYLSALLFEHCLWVPPPVLLVLFDAVLYSTCYPESHRNKMGSVFASQSFNAQRQTQAGEQFVLELELVFLHP